MSKPDVRNHTAAAVPVVGWRRRRNLLPIGAAVTTLFVGAVVAVVTDTVRITDNSASTGAVPAVDIELADISELPGAECADPGLDWKTGPIEGLPSEDLPGRGAPFDLANLVEKPDVVVGTVYSSSVDLGAYCVRSADLDDLDISIQAVDIVDVEIAESAGECDAEAVAFPGPCSTSGELSALVAASFGTRPALATPPCDFGAASSPTLRTWSAPLVGTWPTGSNTCHFTVRLIFSASGADRLLAAQTDDLQFDFAVTGAAFGG